MEISADVYNPDGTKNQRHGGNIGQRGARVKQLVENCCTAERSCRNCPALLHPVKRSSLPTFYIGSEPLSLPHEALHDALPRL